MGPIGSGKSSACILDLWWRACCQQPYNGIRETKWIVIRNTYPDLLHTTFALWQEWVPQELYTATMGAPIKVRLRHPLPDGTEVRADLLFVALDRPEDVPKLKSFNATGVWINEAVEIDRSVFDMALGRCDRFPPMRYGGATYPTLIMDTNPPDDEHWYYELAELIRPEGYRFFRQPPALLRVPSTTPGIQDAWVPNEGQDPNWGPAENVRHHKRGFDYWLRQVPGKDAEWLKVYIEGNYGSVMHGKPVYPEFRDDWHTAKEDLRPYPQSPILLGWDFGRMPAVVVCQYTPQGNFRVIDEKMGEDCSVTAFVQDIARPYIRTRYGDLTQTISRCDPAGKSRDQITNATCLEILDAAGFQSDIATTNSFFPRREAVAKLLLRAVDGRPLFQLSPRCAILRKGFRGGYCFSKLSRGFGPTHSAEPEKNLYSHPHDALQYIALYVAGASLHGGSTSGAPACSPPRPHQRAGWTH